MTTEPVDLIIAAILFLAAVVTPVWAIVTDKKKYITPKKKDQNNGFAQDRP